MLAAASAIASRVRATGKPLHPSGVVVGGRVERRGLTPPVGLSWLDEPGQDDVAVRLSRRPGYLPGRLRGPTAHDHRDRPARALRPPVETSTAEHASYGSILPYRAPNGPLLLAARALETLRRFALCVASPLGRWRRFGTLVLEPLEAARDADIDFDAMLNVLPGLPPYDWVRRLPEGAYAAARRSRVRPA